MKAQINATHKGSDSILSHLSMLLNCDNTRMYECIQVLLATLVGLDSAGACMLLEVLPTKPSRVPHDLIYLGQRYSRSGTDCNAGQLLKIATSSVIPTLCLSSPSSLSRCSESRMEGTLLARQLQGVVF
jgi:hypothetical protein